MRGDLDALRALVELAPEAVVRRGGCSGRTPCVVAIKAGQLEAARWLFRRAGGTVGQVLPAGKLLMFAVRSGSPELVHWVGHRVLPGTACLPAEPEALFKLWGLALANAGMLLFFPLVCV